MQRNTVTIYRAGRQLTRLRLIVPLCLVTGAALLWLAWATLFTYGQHPSEGGTLAPLPVRLLLGSGFGALGVFIIGGITLYTQFCYVTRIETAEQPHRWRIGLAGLVASRTIEIDARDILPATFHDRLGGGGPASGGREAAAAPWYSVRVRGRRWPLVIDVQGDFIDPVAFARGFRELPAGGLALEPRSKRGRATFRK